ncbi:FTR1 family protein [Candidatus Peregrinibacteria bacterium]|nr:FTR1 family protein [Candidatus Peregrinibacteria bacterium]
MFESFLITFRETLEASLVVFIILSYLKKTGQSRNNFIVYAGVIGAVIVSAIAAWFFQTIAGGLTGEVEEIFEGTTMILAAILLTTMIIWMAHAKHVQHQIEARVAVELSDRHRLGLFAVVFIAVLREGVETVIFLGAIAMRGANQGFLGALLGIFTAAFLGYFLFAGAKRMGLKTFFRVTSALLIFFAAGLIAHGIHEFQEVGWIPFWSQEAWNTAAFLSEKSVIGSIFKGVFGYNENPSILEVAAYIGYLLLMLLYSVVSRHRDLSKRSALAK